MKIKELDQHCGDCGITEYCGNAYGYSVCRDERFGEIEESEYVKIAETATDIKQLEVCIDCDRPDCGVYRYSENDFADEPCEHDDEERDHYCLQIADHVAKTLKEVGE